MATKSAQASQRQPSWADIKTKLEAFDKSGLVGLVHDLYEASTANRRFLQARLLPSPSAVEKYRRLVAAAVFPDPFSRRRVSLRDGTAAITEYRRSTGDVEGAVDLTLTFIEAGQNRRRTSATATRTTFRRSRINSTPSPNRGLHFRRTHERRRRLGSRGCRSVRRTLVGGLAITSMTSSHV